MKRIGLKQRLLRIWRFKIRIPVVGLGVRGAYLAVAAFAITGVLVQNTSSQHPLGCISCHEMRSSLTSKSLSSHRDIGCESCHETPDLITMAKLKLEASMAKDGAGGPAVVKPHGLVNEEKCKSCHPTVDDVVVYHGLKITHKQHLDRNIGCLVCHSTVAHGKASSNRSVPEMKMCMDCHDGRVAPSTCSVCHETKATNSPARLSPEWVEGHKREVEQQGREDCARCHSEESCQACHRLTKSHPKDWLKSHARRFNEKPEECYSCHPKSEWRGFCDECHAVKLAHAKDWVAKHPASMNDHADSCGRCHDRKFCGWPCQTEVVAHRLGIHDDVGPPVAFA